MNPTFIETTEVLPNPADPFVCVCCHQEITDPAETQRIRVTQTRASLYYFGDMLPERVTTYSVRAHFRHCPGRV